MAAFVVDKLQKEFDQAIASFFFENAIAFNATRSDSYKNMKRIMNEASKSREVLKLSGYNFLRMKALPTKYKTVDNDLDKIREPWDVTCLTLMTDGTTTTSNRPVINFIAAGDSGAVMVKTVDVEGKDKATPSLARMEYDPEEVKRSDGFSTPDPGLRLGERFAFLLSHVAPIAPRGSAQDFCKHLASISPMRIDDESNTPNWARFIGPTPPTLRLNEDIPLIVGEGTHAQVYRRRTTLVQDGGTTPPHDMRAQRAKESPPDIDESKVH
ncbi:hypothetical protein CBR_g38274 [Chara braunii]|uniref:DUF659 domain-containing protein n=1 Tax=Chara braunii TaxID=69332 RepID=A0A388LPS5_CHABU|nr:hypothetical protein CBR_g38274 [Chara braunii]|eukprot:GBG84304.1 hypothetical protein CBR_g38274 [Chara braunii]